MIPKSDISRVTVYKEYDPLTSFVISIPLLNISEYCFYINPSSFTWSFGDKRQDISHNLIGYTESNYPDDLDKLSFEGSTGGFVSLTSGYNMSFREDTIAYLKFKDILNMFKNNSNSYDDFGRINYTDHVILTYQGVSFFGMFIDFSYEERDDSPYKFDISYSFLVEDTKGVF